MKKVISLALAALLCFSLSLSAFADGFVDKPVVVEKPVPSTTVVNPPVSDSDSVNLIKKFVDYGYNAYNEQIQGELAYFFTVLVNDKYGLTSGDTPRYRGEKDKYIDYTYTSVSCSSVRARSGDKYLDCFDPDYLAGYFAIFSYVSFTTDYDGVLFMKEYYNSLSGDHGAAIFLATPPNPKDILSALSLYVIKYDFLTFSDYYNTLYAKYLEENGSSGISVGYENENPEKYVQPIKVPAEDFKQYVQTANKYYSPKSTGKYISYRTDEWYGKKNCNYPLIPLYNGGFCGERWNEVYLMPFYTDGEDRYYSEYQLHFYLERADNENGDGWTTTFAVEWFSNFDDIDEKKGKYVIKEGMTSTEYVIFPSICDNQRRFLLFSYPSYSLFLERSFSSSYLKTFSTSFDGRFYKSGDLFTSVSNSGFFWNHFRQTYSDHDGSCLYGSADDIGYYYSNMPITVSYSNIDTEKIPDSYYITVSGDTIYDYSITNPDTGQSSTINEYITNNYTYITNNNPSGDGSGSDTTGGNVTVGGNVGVNGNVNVGGEVKFGGEVNVGVDVSPIDINVNVNGNGGAGESGGDPPEIGGVDDLVDYLPEKSPVISEYLKIFFDVLPPELLNLILAGVAAAIIILIFRR